MDIAKKSIIVTGGASGLGAATTRALHAAGAKLAIFDQDEVAAGQLLDELGTDQVLFQACDISNAEEVASAVATVVQRFSTVHVCINCAGVAAPAKILDRDGSPTPLHAFKRTVEINLVGTYNVMSQCASVMLRNSAENNEERGVIINVASGAAFEGQIGQCAYASSKNGVIGLNLPAARELGPHGIRVNAIAPGLFGTPMVKAMGEKVINSLVDMIEAPKRVGEMREFAHCCAFIIENAYLNGETIRLDAATRLRAR